MKRLALLILLGWSRTGYAWNSTGHKAIALIAYERPTPVTKQRVDQLLARHPDYPKWIAGITTADRGRAAFLAASVWPDTIRSDPRFHDDNRQPTAPIKGLPHGAQARRAGWHFTNMPFTTDGTATVPGAVPNIITKLEEFANIGRMPV